jgi:hypothetical protein
MQHLRGSNQSLRQLGAGLLLCAIVLTSGATNLGRADDGHGSGKNGNNNNAEVRLRTQLAGGAIAGKRPEGNADFRMEPAKNRTRLNVEVENVSLAQGTILTVSIMHGAVSTNAGTITLNAFGGGELELNSQDGDTVPAIVAGDVVTVSNAGSPILTGVFGN